MVDKAEHIENSLEEVVGEGDGTERRRWDGKEEMGREGGRST